MSDRSETKPPADEGRLDRRVRAPSPERAAYDAWYAAATFETMGHEWTWAAWKACRDDAAAQLERTARGMRENAQALRKWPGMEQEARARELAACNVDELAGLWRMERQLGELLERHNAALTGSQPT